MTICTLFDGVPFGGNSESPRLHLCPQAAHFINDPRGYSSACLVIYDQPSLSADNLSMNSFSRNNDPNSIEKVFSNIASNKNVLDMILPMVIISDMTSQELKAWRKTNGYTQKRLADALGAYQVTVARWENGTRSIPSHLALALKALECEEKTRKESADGKHLSERKDLLDKIQQPRKTGPGKRGKR